MALQLALSVSLFVLASADQIPLQVGKVPEYPVRLNKENFRQALDDPVNPFWLLKYYAPWCGHCKNLAPILDRVAKKRSGKMAVGVIDCTTTGKPLCNERGINSYPTLKFSLDGEIQDYPGGRSERDFLAFADKMTSLSVAAVKHTDEAYAYAKNIAHEHIVFVAYHPQAAAAEGSVKEKLQASPLTQVFAQVARKEQAFAHFLMLDSTPAPPPPPVTEGEEQPQEPTPPIDPAASFGKSGPFICRVEKDFPMKCLENVDQLDAQDLLHWVRTQNVPTLSYLEPSSFQKIGRKGRPLVIGVVIDKTHTEQVKEMTDVLTKFATTGPEHIREKYYYGYFPGQPWALYLEQFDVWGAPEIFVYDVESKMYYHDSKYEQDVESLLRDIEEGKIQPRRARRKGAAGYMDMITEFADNNTMGVSVAICCFLFYLFVSLAKWAASEDDDENFAPSVINVAAAAKDTKDDSKKEK